jgi:hypothetical protein
MARTSEAEEVQVLRFFEGGQPLERVEAVFHIVCEKMRQRQGRDGDGNPSPPRAARRQTRRKTTNPGAEPQIPGE